MQTPPQADDFSREKPVISLEAPLSLTLDKLDETAWIDRVARASGLYRTEASVKSFEHDVQYCSAAFRARATTTWLVNSEGTIVRKSASTYQENFGVGTQAADGMKIERSRRHDRQSLSTTSNRNRHLTKVPLTSSPLSPTCAKRHWLKRSITVPFCSAPTQALTPCVACSAAASQPRGRASAPKPAPTAPSRAATTPVFFLTFSTSLTTRPPRSSTA